jgi:outer membrane protein assembly factor BamB
MRRLIAFVCALSLTGCAGLDVVKDAWDGLGDYFGGRDNAEPPKELREFAPGKKLSLLWETSVGKGYEGQYLNLIPAVEETAVYVADHRGLIQARDRMSGEKHWEVEAGLPFSAGPGLGRNELVLGTDDGEVAAYAKADGALLWKTSVSSEVLAPPAVESGIVVVRSSDGRIAGLDGKTGATLWVYERSAPALAVRGKGGPVIAGDLVIDGYGGGKLIALGLKDGKTIWESIVALPHGRSEIERLVDMDAAPAIKGDTLYVSGYQGGVAAVSLRDGEVQWRQEKIFSHSGLAATRRSLFLADASSDVWRLDMRDGGDLWKQDELHQRRLTAPALLKDYLAVGDFEGYVHILSQDDGALLARVRIDDEPIEAAPAEFDDVIYVYSSGGKLAALSVE